VALTHYPVLNKNGDVITSAITNLDLHDIARVSKTYGIRAFYVITPLVDQRTLVERVVSHWTKGAGSRYNPKRREALELIKIKTSLEEVKAHIQNKEGDFPKTVVTSAKNSPNNISFDAFRDMLKGDHLYLMIFGTAWGLAEKCITEADYFLDPIWGNSDYNHLSVRSASAIILDRLFGREK
jgi:hypothetical protein